MKILHISAECYPAAKAGGMGDVVGALPIYQNKKGHLSEVIIPKYNTPWLENADFEEIHSGSFLQWNSPIEFKIYQLKNKNLPFILYAVDIPGKFDRKGIYGDQETGWYSDETERFLAFQSSVLHWLLKQKKKPDILHCHDHHTGLIPYLVKNCEDFKKLASIPTIFTIHNGEYTGAFEWDKLPLLPSTESSTHGLLDWNGQIHPLASAIKCSWHFTTVSKSYLEDIMQTFHGMEELLRKERTKATGILNGIDQEIWSPSMDPLLIQKFEGDTKNFKSSNKQGLLKHFQFNPDYPVITFIGRLVKEKGADLLPDLYQRMMFSGVKAAFLVLGTGEKEIEDTFLELKKRYPGRFDAVIAYDENLAHQMYAGSDFIIMPSRVEPCGLNQMYAMRYGTIPIVRAIGGLKDTVPDIDDVRTQGRGIQFTYFTLDDAALGIYRAGRLYLQNERMDQLRNHLMSLDFSWDSAADQYLNIYNQYI